MALEEYKFNEESDLRITTRDTVYNFNKMENPYYLENDTLVVGGSMIVNGKLKSHIKIPINDIEEIEVNRFDAGLTIFLTIGLALVIILTIGIVKFATEGPL